MQETLRSIARQLSHGQHDESSYPWHALRFDTLDELNTLLLQTQSQNTVNKKLSAVKGVLRAAFELGLMGEDDYRDARDVRGKAIAPTEGRSVTADEIKTLLAACSQAAAQNPAKAARDAAIVVVLCSDAAPERREVIAYDYADAKALRRKVSKEHRRLLDAWLAIRGEESGPLFCPINRWENLVRAKDGTLQRMTPQGLHHAIASRMQDAGIVNLTLDDFRRAQR